jgi:hypothetical protein
MTADTLEQELKALPEEERAKIIKTVLNGLSPRMVKTLERQMRRLAHPEIPDDVWIGFEEAEDGLGLEVKEEHFYNPPV